MSVEYNPTTVTDGLMFCIDPANKRSYSRNCHPMPTDIYGWVSSMTSALATRATVSRDNTVVSPVGNTPLKFINNANDSFIESYNRLAANLAPAVSGQTWTVSVYAKANVATTCQIFIFGATASGAYVEAPAGTINITTEWQRFSYTYTFSNASTEYIQTRLDGPDVYSSPVTIWFDGLQVERSSSMTGFNPNINVLNTSVNDLVGSNKLTIYGDCTFNDSGYVTFPTDTTTQYLMNSTFPFPVDDHTIECWYNSNFTQDTQTPYTYSVAGDNHYLCYLNSSTEIAPHSFNNSSYTITVPNMLGVWCNFTRTRVKLTGQENYYLNGVLVGNRIISANTATPTNGYLIVGQEADTPGGGFSSGQNLDGSFSKLAIYDRALTDVEVQQNFNALRGRYGL
jgi:hypothetical protein